MFNQQHVIYFDNKPGLTKGLTSEFAFHNNFHHKTTKGEHSEVFSASALSFHRFHRALISTTVKTIQMAIIQKWVKYFNISERPTPTTVFERRFFVRKLEIFLKNTVPS